tara:strand:+ start:412 stop:885 length:474 start_codon:yes stop_codon:yes gene_type:complete
MIKTLIRAMYSAFISIVLISIILAGWTSYAFIFQSSKSSEIFNVIQDMYESQISVVIDVIDLSKILVKGTSENNANENNNLLVQRESLTDLEDPSLIEESLIFQDNGDNPLGIVIEPSLREVSENKLPEISEEPLVNEQTDFFIDEIEIETSMDMTP